MDQIQLSLGHKSFKTTERYLGVEQNLTDAPGDHLGLTLGTDGLASRRKSATNPSPLANGGLLLAPSAPQGERKRWEALARRDY